MEEYKIDIVNHLGFIHKKIPHPEFFRAFQGQDLPY